jgi:hypothetical protein
LDPYSETNYCLASALGAQHAFLQSSPHFFSPFLAPHALVLQADLSPSFALHAGFLPSAFLALHPQVSQASAEDPATNRAIAAILIILFMVHSPLLS